MLFISFIYTFIGFLRQYVWVATEPCTCCAEEMCPCAVLGVYIEVGEYPPTSMDIYYVYVYVHMHT